MRWSQILIDLLSKIKWGIKNEIDDLILSACFMLAISCTNLLIIFVEY